MQPDAHPSPITLCPLVSDYPLSDPAASRIDQSLLGKLKAENPNPKEQGIFSFLPFDEHELLMRLVDDGLLRSAGISSSARLLDFIRLNATNPKLYAPEQDKAPYDLAWTREPG
jgi:hypothetical protein